MAGEVLAHDVGTDQHFLQQWNGQYALLGKQTVVRYNIRAFSRIGLMMLISAATPYHAARHNRAFDATGAILPSLADSFRRPRWGWETIRVLPRGGLQVAQICQYLLVCHECADCSAWLTYRSSYPPQVLRIPCSNRLIARAHPLERAILFL